MSTQHDLTLQEHLDALLRGDLTHASALAQSEDPVMRQVAQLGDLLQQQKRRWEQRERLLHVLLEVMINIASGDLFHEFELEGEDELVDAVMTALHMTAEELHGMYEDVEAARDEALTASMNKSHFLATVSHELRTPLNAIIGYTELIIEDAENAVFDHLLEDSVKIRQASEHLLSLISDVLDISKIEANRLELHLSTFDPAKICNNLSHMLAPLFDDRGNTLVTHFSEDLGSIHTDRRRLHQILLNLLSNANKFTKNGTITFSASRTAQTMRFVIEDSGIGISPEKLETIFDPFVQASNTTSLHHGGTGLGLAISRNLARVLGGDITAENAPQGSRFIVDIRTELST